MSSAPPPSNPPPNPEKAEDISAPDGSAPIEGAAAMDESPDVPPEETWDDIPEDILNLATDEILTRARLIDNDLKVIVHISARSTNLSINLMQVMRSETMRLQHEQNVMKEKIRDNGEKIKQNKVLPYLVGNVVEVSWVVLLHKRDY